MSQISKHEHTVLAKAFFDAAMQLLDRAHTEAIHATGHLSDDTHELSRLITQARRAGRDLNALIQRTGS